MATRKNKSTKKKQGKIVKNPAKMNVKDLVDEVAQKREKTAEKHLKKNVMKMLKNNTELYKKLATLGSVSTIADQLIPLGKEMIQHPDIIDEVVHNEPMKQEMLENPVVVTQLLQIPEVADNVAREPSLIVDILQDASQVKSLTKSLSKSSPHVKPVIPLAEIVHMENVIDQEKKNTGIITGRNCMWAALLVAMGVALTFGPGKFIAENALPVVMNIKDDVVNKYVPFAINNANVVENVYNEYRRVNQQNNQNPMSKRPMYQDIYNRREDKNPMSKRPMYQDIYRPASIKARRRSLRPTPRSQDEEMRLAYELQGKPYNDVLHSRRALRPISRSRSAKQMQLYQPPMIQEDEEMRLAYALQGKPYDNRLHSRRAPIQAQRQSLRPISRSRSAKQMQLFQPPMIKKDEEMRLAYALQGKPYDNRLHGRRA